jgi:hypothetical protein
MSNFITYHLTWVENAFGGFQKHQGFHIKLDIKDLLK